MGKRCPEQKMRKSSFVLMPALRNFLSKDSHSIHFVIDNTETLLRMLENSELDFIAAEGIFDKTRYKYHLFKKENFVGVCAKTHRFAGQKIPLDEIFKETLIIREPGSGTRRLLEQAIMNRGFTLEHFRRVLSISNFSVITDMTARSGAITFAYEPVALQRNDLAVFDVEDMHIMGEFNFVYCNETIAKEKIWIFFNA